MKKLLNVSQNAVGVDIALFIARVGIAAMMLTHGIPKLMMLFSGEPIQFLPFLGTSPEFSLSLAVFAEVFCSVLLLFGVGTRLVVLPLMTTMLVALLTVHTADPFAKQEPAFHYLLVYIVLLFAGGGKYSIDYLLQRKGTTQPAGRLRNKALSVQ